MGVTIKSIHRMDGHHDRHVGRVTHNGNPCEAVLFGPFEKLQALLNTDTTAEYELDEIISVTVNLPKEDIVSGIYALADGQVAIDGSVHNEIRIDDTASLFDVYIQNGADFLTVSTEDLKERPEIGTRIRIIGKGLCIYPTFT